MVRKKQASFQLHKFSLHVSVHLLPNLVAIRFKLQTYLNNAFAGFNYAQPAKNSQ